MAIGWLGLLKAVPWGEVVSNAPKIADGAKSLWGAVSRKVRPGEPAAGDPVANASLPVGSRLAALEASNTELQRQLVTSSELLRSLADQDAQLIVRIDALRGRMRWLTLLAVAALAIAGTALALLLNR